MVARLGGCAGRPGPEPADRDPIHPTGIPAGAWLRLVSGEMADRLVRSDLRVLSRRIGVRPEFPRQPYGRCDGSDVGRNRNYHRGRVGGDLKSLAEVVKGGGVEEVRGI